MRQLIRIAMLVLAFTPTASHAQTHLESGLSKIVGTLSAYSEPIFSNGVLEGCTIVFSAVANDSKYEVGSYIKVDGNFGIFTGQERFGANVKVVVHRFSEANGKPVLTPSPPTRAYLVSKNLTTTRDAQINSFDGGTPGGIFVVFDGFRGLEIVAEILEHGTIGVAFNQQNGNSEIVLPIDFAVKKTDRNGQRVWDREAIESFSSCVLEATKSLTK